jgi:hypothetical protein
VIGVTALIPLGLAIAGFAAIRSGNKYIGGGRHEVSRRLDEFQGHSVRCPPYFQPSVEGDAWASHVAVIASIISELTPEERELIDSAFYEDPFSGREENGGSRTFRRLPLPLRPFSLVVAWW